jgi:hypothetical protein
MMVVDVIDIGFVNDGAIEKKTIKVLFLISTKYCVFGMICGACLVYLSLRVAQLAKANGHAPRLLLINLSFMASHSA